MDQGEFLVFGGFGGRTEFLGLSFVVMTADGWNDILHGYHQWNEIVMLPQNAF